MIKYVELSRKQYFAREVEADTNEAAVDAVLYLAPGNPADWSIELVQDAHHRETATPEPGAITFNFRRDVCMIPDCGCSGDAHP